MLSSWVAVAVRTEERYNLLEGVGYQRLDRCFSCLLARLLARETLHRRFGRLYQPCPAAEVRK